MKRRKYNYFVNQYFYDAEISMRSYTMENFGGKGTGFAIHWPWIKANESIEDYSFIPKLARPIPGASVPSATLGNLPNANNAGLYANPPKNVLGL